MKKQSVKFSKTKEIEQVREFHLKFGHPVEDNPTDLTFPRTFDRHKWMKEELHEFLFAKDLTEKVDAIIDLIYLAKGTLIEMGVGDRYEALFTEVHESNMSKLGLDGKPVYHKDGKVKKGENYFPPNLKKIIES